MWGRVFVNKRSLADTAAVALHWGCAVFIEGWGRGGGGGVGVLTRERVGQWPGIPNSLWRLTICHRRIILGTAGFAMEKRFQVLPLNCWLVVDLKPSDHCTAAARSSEPPEQAYSRRFRAISSPSRSDCHFELWSLREPGKRHSDPGPREIAARTENWGERRNEGGRGGSAVYPPAQVLLRPVIRPEYPRIGNRWQCCTFSWTIAAGWAKIRTRHLMNYHLHYSLYRRFWWMGTG